MLNRRGRLLVSNPINVIGANNTRDDHNRLTINA
jgi:hypothetical protein